MTTGKSNYGNQDAAITGTSGSTGYASTSVDPAKQAVGQVTDQTKQAVHQVTEQTKQTAQSQLANRKDQAAQGLNVVSSAVHGMGDQLRQNDQTSAYAQYADQAAEQIQRFSGYLQSRDIRQIAYEVEDWAHREPVLAIGGAFALGLLAARFLKSSSAQGGASGSSGRGRGYARYNRYEQGAYDPYSTEQSYGLSSRPMISRPMTPGTYGPNYDQSSLPDSTAAGTGFYSPSSTGGGSEERQS